MKKDFMDWEEWDKEANKYADGKEGLVIITNQTDEEALKKQFNLPVIVFLIIVEVVDKPENFVSVNACALNSILYLFCS